MITEKLVWRVENTKRTSLAFFSIVTGFSILAQPGIAAMSIAGTTGLVDIPTARIIPDGRVAFGIGYTDKNHSLRGPKYAQVAYYVTVGYLPFLEGSLRITNFPGNMQPGAYGSEKDRMASVKILVRKEGCYMPSVLLGIHDVLGVYNSENPEANVNFNAAYIVVSKSIRLAFAGSLDIHMGYASDVVVKKASHYSMLGVFAGLEKELCEYLSVMGEYDTQKCNVGLRITPVGEYVNIDLAILGLKHISGGMSISFGL